MNKRSFLKTISLISSCVSLSPTIFIPRFEPVKWKRLNTITTFPVFTPEGLFGKWNFILGGTKECPTYDMVLERVESPPIRRYELTEGAIFLNEDVPLDKDEPYFIGGIPIEDTIVRPITTD